MMNSDQWSVVSDQLSVKNELKNASAELTAEAHFMGYDTLAYQSLVPQLGQNGAFGSVFAPQLGQKVTFG